MFSVFKREFLFVERILLVLILSCTSDLLTKSLYLIKYFICCALVIEISKNERDTNRIELNFIHFLGESWVNFGRIFSGKTRCAKIRKCISLGFASLINLTNCFDVVPLTIESSIKTTVLP